MTVFFRPMLFSICILLCAPAWAQSLKGSKVCRAELRLHAAEIRSAKVKRRDFLAACRRTAVGQDTPIGDKAAPAPEAAAAKPAPAAEPTQQPAPPPPAPEPAPAPKPETAAPASDAAGTPPEGAPKPEDGAAKPEEATPPLPETDKTPARAAKPATEVAPAEDHTLPGWWNWTMRLAAAAAFVVAALFAVRGLMRIRRAGG